jgi:RNA recognition motif-containing protein
MGFPPTAYGAATGAYQSYPAAAAAAAGAAGGYQQQQSFQQLQAMQDAAAHATVQGQFTLYVGGLPQGVDEGSLYKMFSPYGAVAGVKVVMDQQNPTMNRGFAFVNFVRSSTASRSLAHSDPVPL